MEFKATIMKGIKDKSVLLATIAQELKFPHYFGHNWDALDECLRDLSWIKEEQIVLIHEDIPLANRKDQKIYLSILSDAEKFWANDKEHLFHYEMPKAKKETKNIPQTRIMYIERKVGLSGPARIGRVRFNRTGKTLEYKGKRFQSLKGRGFKANYYEIDTGEEYWISGCHKDGKDALYNTDVEIDDDVLEEYWRDIRQQPKNIKTKKFKMLGKQ